MTINDNFSESPTINAAEVDFPPGPVAELKIEGRDYQTPFVLRGEAGSNGHVRRTDGAATLPHDRYHPFPINELQHAYILGRSRNIPLGGIGCRVYVEYPRPSLDPSRFERIWNALIRRNEILRLVTDGVEHQRILPDVPWFKVPVIPIAGTDPDQIEAALAAIREDMARHVYDVTVWPLHDVRIAAFADGSGRVFSSFDLIGIDAASAFRLSGLVAQAYESQADEDWSPPAIGYREHRMAEIAGSGGATWQRDREYWQKVLPSLPTAPNLPYAAPFHALTPPRFSRVARHLDHATVERLASAAARHRLTLSKVINAAFAEIIAAWSSERYFLLNLPIFRAPDDAGRAEPVLGNHTSTILVAADMRTGTFVDRARGLWRNLARALRHRSYPGVSILQDLRRLRGEGFAPVAPVVMTNLLSHHSVDSGWPMDYHRSRTETPQVTLDHQIILTADGLQFHWDAVTGAFHSGVVEAMADAHLSLLARLVEDENAWTELGLCVIGAEQRAVRARVNATDCALETGLLHDGFFATARRTPQAIALIEGERSITYGDLAALAEGVRKKLVENDVGPGEPICCALPHGIGLAAVALGTLLHGAVYVPLDPLLPVHRRRREIDILKARIAFVDGASGEVLAELGLRTIDMRSVTPLREQALPQFRAKPDDRAYIIFTSGTTGDPKAIVISHRGAANTCADLIDRFSIGPQDRVLALSSPTFDLSVFDLFGLWAAGGCAVLPAPEARLDPAIWVSAISRHGVSIWNTVPALMTMLVAHCEARGQVVAPLRVVMLSGDWIPPSLVSRMPRIAPEARLFSLGGATEASIWSIIHPIAQDDARLPSIPYGVPLLNQTIHVLDETLAERPDHVEGDIFIGGSGLAEGYLGEAERTADAFVTHPTLGRRIYRTGDRGRRRPDGLVEFLGRRDTQFKRQGFRIEAGEVECALRSAEGIADAVVEAVGERFDTKRLAAFVVAAREHVASADDADVGNTRISGKASTSVRTFEQPLPRISLARELAPEDVAGLTKRRSARAFERKPVPLTDLSRLLAPLRPLQTAAGPKYRYPSASGLYPVQVYLYCEPDRIEGLDAGLYYVDPAGDLVLLSTERFAMRELHVAHNRGLAESAAFTLLMFANMPAMASYGPLARDLCLIEAGYMGQALMEAATETTCALCPIGAMAFGTIAASAGLSSDSQFLHAFVGGTRVEAENESLLALPQPAVPTILDRVARLREHAASRLPAYMLPDDIFFVDQFPLSSNAKVDRAALRALALARPNDVRPAQPPSTETESRLTAIASRILGQKTIDIDREFLALGADSVKLVEFAAAIEVEFGQRFQVVDAFAHPTIRKLAAHLSPDARVGAASDQPASRARRRAESRRNIRPRQPADGRDG